MSDTERIATELVRCGSANVSDGLRSLGRHFQSMDGGIRPLAAAAAVAGPAFTVRCYPGATWALEQALDAAKPGDVLVVDGGGGADVILMGALMSRRAQQRGIAGAVLDAAVRDVADIIELGFPVFSRHVCPRAGVFEKIGETQTIICCGRIPVRPGDWVVGDASGVALIPMEMLNETLAAARAINAREQRIDELLKSGLSLGEAAAKIPKP